MDLGINKLVDSKKASVHILFSFASELTQTTMNSMVVLFSVMVLANAKPAIPTVYSFPGPAAAVAVAPAAVSQQARIDLQSAPAVYKTNVIDSGIAPALVAAPVAYSAPVAIAPASVSTESRLDIKSSPAVVSTIPTSPLAYNAALPYGAPVIAYGAPLAFAPSIYTPAVAAAITPALLKTAIAPEAESAPAKEESVNQALPVAPTETPEVAAARAAHLAAKALEESHQIQKRSAVIATSPLVTSYAAPLVTSYASSPIVYSSPIARITPVGVHTPILSGAYGIHPY